jgi:hypothetical protein
MRNNIASNARQRFVLGFLMACILLLTLGMLAPRFTVHSHGYDYQMIWLMPPEWDSRGVDFSSDTPIQCRTGKAYAYGFIGILKSQAVDL